MNKVIAFFFLLISLNTQAQGNSGFNSEISHFAGGAVSTAAAVVIIDKYFPEQNSAWVGFALSSTVDALLEYRQYQLGDNSASAALLDASSHALGAAVGAYLTGKYIITPTVALDANNNFYTGINIAFDF
ncbi:hypothetical protein Ping_0803 [Psychromonas ingrahamii 37]|uniref:Uncharacterized protein n=1 Tax=Psychromonas ingrahamii (strain DSM 17664 / CCUG 51855 / 37) TaxID=357804 RepID=A1ST32_PSYIN|nr:hypothetical protein [Psychromonas ingrahamii]ABM02647.1 hypothetical protein Ping_0803 [Psychromonas ingrahamii 37]